MVADDFEGEINRFLSLNQLSSMFRKRSWQIGLCFGPDF